MNAPNATQCPADCVLSDFGLGKLDVASADTISRHIETCADCQRRVASISGDSFVGRLRQADNPAPRRDRTYVPGESLANAANSTDGSLEDGLPRPSSKSNEAKPDGLVPARRDSVSAPPELANHPDYELIKELGHGGMGVVYLAKNRTMDRLEVLKVVSRSLLNKPEAMERFQKEIRSAARLLHPHIVAAYSVVRPVDSLVFAMEYVPGHDLLQVVKKRGYLPIANASFYAYQAALGLEHAHEKGMVHRDIKPSNLMLAIEGKKHVVKILDFGLAKATSETIEGSALTQSGQILGTPGYIAPEQAIDARGADIRADIYSLGCTLYHLLAGHPPFQEPSLYALLEAHQRREPKPLNLVRPDVPIELAAIVSKMLAKDPANRYQTPLQVARILAPYFKAGQAPASDPLPPHADTAMEREDRRPSVANLMELSTGEDHPAVPAPAGDPVNIVTASAESAALAAELSTYARRPSRRRHGWWWSLPQWQRLAIPGGAAALLLLAVVLTIRTPRGTVEIALSDPNANVTVTVDKDRIRITELDNPLTLAVGEHDLTVTGEGFETVTKRFTVTRGKNAPMTIALVPRGGKPEHRLLNPVEAAAAASQDRPLPIVGGQQQRLPSDMSPQVPAVEIAADALPISGLKVPASEPYDRLLLPFMARWRLPGGALAVAKDGRLVLERGYGFRDVDRKIAVEPHHLFRLPGGSQAITSAAILRLADQGRLKLDDPLRRWLGDDSGLKEASDSRVYQITLRQLLHSTEGWGLAKGNVNPKFSPKLVAETVGGAMPPSVHDLMRFIFRQPLAFAPGTRYSPSDLGYCVLSPVIEAASGMPYEAAVKDLVLKPAGIDRMRIGHTRLAERDKDEVLYYAAASERLVPSVFPDVKALVPLPDGGFYLESLDCWIGSAGDMMRFVTALDGSRKPGLLTDARLQELIERPGATVMRNDEVYQGLGWLVRPMRDGANWWCYGSLSGSYSLIVRSSTGLSWIAMFNSRPTNDLAVFSTELDELLWVAARQVTEWPSYDLFSNPQSQD